MTAARDPLTPADLAAIEEREAALKGGPFEVWCGGNVYTANYVSRENAIRKLATDDVPALLAEVRRLQADNERMRRGLEEVDAPPACCPSCDRSRMIRDNLLAGREWSEGG